MSPIPVDYPLLADQLSALAYPARLELLSILKVPHLASEIRLTARRVGPGENPDRPAAKPTVQAHLDKLVERDFLRVADVGKGRKTFQYSVNPLKVYAVIEDLRRLNTIYAGSGPAGDATGTVTHETRRPPPKGPRLVLVHGVYEGKAYPLTPATRHDGKWTIGRRLGSSVTLEYDGYVSGENTEITESDGTFYVRDLGSKNGTSLNWEPLEPGHVHALRPADVLGIGRSLLVFADT